MIGQSQEPVASWTELVRLQRWIKTKKRQQLFPQRVSLLGIRLVFWRWSRWHRLFWIEHSSDHNIQLLWRHQDDILQACWAQLYEAWATVRSMRFNLKCRSLRVLFSNVIAVKISLPDCLIVLSCGWCAGRDKQMTQKLTRFAKTLFGFVKGGNFASTEFRNSATQNEAERIFGKTQENTSL